VEVALCAGTPDEPSPPIPSQRDTVVCVALPAAPVRATPRVPTAANCGRLDLRACELTVLPCLHLSLGEVATEGRHSNNDATGKDDSQRASCTATAHGSGDASAVHLHAVNLRQNHLSTLLTPFARCNTGGYAASPSFKSDSSNSSGPRSTPLQFYAHISSLDLTHNELTSIEGVEVLHCLRSLRVAFNKLTSLSPLWASPYVAELDVLDVSNNSLTELITVDDVHALEAHHVRIVTHPTQARSTTGGQRSTKSTTTYKSMRLRVLYASNNELRVIPSAIYTLSHLADMRLRKNVIESVPEGFPSQACLPALTRLDLSMNRLPASVVAVITARVAGTAEHHRSSSRSRRCSATSARRTRSHDDDDGLPSVSTSVPPFAAATEAPVASSVASGIQLASSDNTVCGESEGRSVGQSLEVVRHQSPLPQPLHAVEQFSSVEAGFSESSVAALLQTQSIEAATAASHDEPSVSPLVFTASPQRSSLSPLRKQRQPPRPRRLGETAARDGTADNSKSEEAPSAKTSSAAKRTRKEAAPVALKEPRRGVPDITPAAAAPPSYESSVEHLGENAYCVNMQEWAATLRYRLSTLTKSATTDASTGTVVTEDVTPVQFTLQELLTALSDTAGSSTVAVNTSASSLSPPATVAGGTGGGGLPRSTRTRQADTARVTAALQQCLPPSNILSFPEDTQAKSPPLLLLAGITASVAADQQSLLLYEVLAHHLVQSCLCTPKSAVPAIAGTGGSSTSLQASYSSPMRIVSPPPEYRRMNSTLQKQQQLSSPQSTSPPPRVLSPPPTTTSTASWRGTVVGERVARSGGAVSSAARQLTFHAPLQVIHVLQRDADGTDAMGESTAAHCVSLLWGYVTWRQKWESAAARRRLKHRSSFVCELGQLSRGGVVTTSPAAQEATTAEAVGEDDTASASVVDGFLSGSSGSDHGCPTNSTAALYPFPCRPAGTRLFEWRRLHEVRPALYSSLPAPWELLYDQLQRAGGTAYFCVPPLISGSCSRMVVVKGSAVSLSCLLLCAAATVTSGGSTSTSSDTTAWPSTASAPSPPPRRRLVSATKHTASPASSASRRSKTVSCGTTKDVIAHALHWQHRSRQLAQRIELEATTIAAEQVQPCAMPLYTALEVQQSQEAALMNLSHCIAAVPTCADSPRTNRSSDVTDPEEANRRREPKPEPSCLSEVSGEVPAEATLRVVEPVSSPHDATSQPSTQVPSDNESSAGTSVTARDIAV
jgi:hypothetical protein